MQKDHKKYLLILQYIFGIGILFVFIKLIFQNIKHFIKILGNINITLFIFSILFYEGINCAWILRIYILLRKYNYKISIFSILQAQLSGMLLGDITPGRSGFLYLTKILKDKGVPYKISISIVMISQAIDLILKGVCAAIGFILLFFYTKVSKFIEIAILFAVFTGIALILMLIYFPNIFVNIPFFRKYSKYLEEFKKHNKNTAKYFIEISTFYFAGWFFAGLQWYFIAKALNLHLSYFKCLFLHPLITSLTFIPITPAGLGIMESGGASILNTLTQIPLCKAFLFLFLARISNIFGDLPGLLFILNKMRGSSENIPDSH